MGAVMYGDMIPLALSEQMFTFAAMFIARIYLAFLYAEAAAYLSSVHLSYSNHVRVRSTIIKYLELHNLPYGMKRRVYKYQDVLWENFKGINENEILRDLPESIQKQIKFSLFSDLIKNVTLFPKDDKVVISALISRLKLQLISEGEHVIRDGEIADSMYFILRGSVNVIKDGVILATLEQGAHFGEMALAERKPTIRTASALCITPVSVGSLSITDFNIICASYPIFESKIEEEVAKRKQDLIDKTKLFDKTKSRVSINVAKFEKEEKLKSLKGSNKGSRQSAYEVEGDTDFIKAKIRKNLNLFETPVRQDQRLSIRSDASQLPPLDIKRNSSSAMADVENEGNNDEANDSKAILVIQENPNMPDSAVMPNPAVYHQDNLNLMNDEESEDYSIKSISRSKKSHNDNENSKNSKNSKDDKSESSSKNEDSQDGMVKVRQHHCLWLWKLLKKITLKNVYFITLFSFV